MKRFHPMATALAIGLLLLTISGCETLGWGHRRTAEDIKAEAYGEADASSKSSKEKSGWSPGAWSSEARDIERNMMRNNTDPNWRQ